MSERHEILNDEEFWLQLEFKASGWLATCDDPHLRGFWIDGFRPERVNNTKFGLQVEGAAWVGDCAGNQCEYHFTAVLPQKLLHRRNPPFVIEGLSLRDEHRTLHVELTRPKSTAEPSSRPNGGPAEPRGSSTASGEMS